MASKYSDFKVEQNVFYLGSQITVIMIFIIPVWINIYCKVLFVYCFHHWSMIIYFISIYFQIIYFVDFILYCLFTSCSLANKFFFLSFIQFYKCTCYLWKIFMCFIFQVLFINSDLKFVTFLFQNYT